MSISFIHSHVNVMFTTQNITTLRGRNPRSSIGTCVRIYQSFKTGGLLKESQFIWKFLWPINTGDCLLEVTAWVGLTVSVIIGDCLLEERRWISLTGGRNPRSSIRTMKVPVSSVST
jgi:hypothetical protein